MKSTQFALSLVVIIRFLTLILLLSVEQAFAVPILFFGWWASWQKQFGYYLSLGLNVVMAGLFGLIMSIPWWISVLIFGGGWWVKQYRLRAFSRVKPGSVAVVIVQLLLTLMARKSVSWRSVIVYSLFMLLAWMAVLIWNRPGSRRQFLSKRVLC